MKSWETLDDSTKRLGSVLQCRCWSKHQPVAALKEVSVVTGACLEESESHMLVWMLPMRKGGGQPGAF